MDKPVTRYLTEFDPVRSNKVEFGVSSIFIGLLSLAILLSTVIPAGASAQYEARKVVMILVDGATLSDFSQDAFPELLRLMNRGAAGLMVTRTARSSLPQHEYMTLGAGTRAIGPSVSQYAYSSKERVSDASAADIYRRNTGLEPPASGAVQPFIEEIKQANSHENYEITPGALGNAIKNAGLKTAVIGNADCDDDPSRLAVNIAMDTSGRVDFGYVGPEVSRRDPLYPGGIRTDFGKLARFFREALNRASFIVVETGDTARLRRQARFLSESVLEARRREAFRNIDELIRNIVSECDMQNTLVIIVIPSVPDWAAEVNNMLTPVFAFGGDLLPGLLTSPSTRRPGLVTNLDIASTVLAHLGIAQPAEMLGRHFESAQVAAPMDYLPSFQERLVRFSVQRAPVSKTYVGFQIVTVFAAILSLLFQSRIPSGAKSVTRAGLLLSMSVPVSMLFSGIRLPDNTFLTIMITWAIAGTIAAGAAYLIRSEIGVIGTLAGITAIMLCADSVTGARLIQGSLLSYDVIGGARFYGMGNEYMGVVLGATIVGLVAFLESVFLARGRTTAGYPGRVLSLIWFLGVTFAVGFPSYGANVGGFLSCVIAFSVVYLGLTREQFKFRHFVFAVICISILLAAFLVYDLLSLGFHSSHFGGFVNSLRANGAKEIIYVIRRKLGMNFRLLRYTIWTRVLVAFFAALGIALYRPSGLLARILRQYRAYARGLIGAFVGAIAAFALNDSGVVAAATVMLFPAMSLLYLMIGHISKDMKNNLI